jgi:uncharacterized SAM-binding protein YcdF (DUF218 family)
LRFRRWFLLGFVLVLIVLGGAERSLYRAIRRQAAREEAQPADAIVVFGAAQYAGRPSPVFKARLDHAFDLEEKGFTSLVITTGGSGGDPRFTEAGAGSEYLIQKGMAANKILTETRSQTTFESVEAVAQLLRERHLKTCIAVSDGFHLYRIKLMFAAQGITAYGSRAPDSPIEADPFQRALHSLREMLISTLWYVGYRG